MKAWRDLAKLPRELWIVCLATFVNRLGTMALPFLVLYLTRRLGFTPARAGATLAVYGGMALLVGPLAGRLADRWGADRMMKGSLIAAGVVLLLFPLARSWPAVLIMTMLYAATNEFFRPANLALVGELGVGEHRKSAFVLSRLAINLGMSVGPAVGGFIVQISFPALFVIDGLTSLVSAAVLIAFAYRSKPRATLSKPPPSPRRGFFDAFLRDADFRIFLLGIIPVAIVFFQHESSMPLFLIRDLHLSESSYGILYTLNTVLIIAVEIPLNSATARWPHRLSMALGALLFALGFGALAFARNYLEVALTVVIWTFGEMILFPSMSAYVSDIAPEGRKGEYMGLYSMAFSLAFVVGPWAGTLALEHFGASALWAGAFGVGLLSAVILGSAKRTA